MKAKGILVVLLLMAIPFYGQCTNRPDGPYKKSNTMFGFFRKHKTIQFNSFRIEENHMKAESDVYVGEKTDNGVRLEHFLARKNWNDSIGDYVETKTMIKCIEGDLQLYEEICRVMTDCHIDRWDGFCGKNPQGILDGTSMQFEAILNDSTIIKARGSNNFPKKYKILREAIRAIINKENN